ncbi:MAG: U32 family peptidase [Candidatus Eremiobacteraeota bacterium]|nr:U32 family peptidase [Candidatus Eremiobacteraeota bacterium]
MKILSPARGPAEILPLIEAGAEELYVGVLASDWRKKYTNIASINRREWSSSNIESYEDLEEVVRIAHEHKARVFLALNALYTKPQYEQLLEHLDRIRAVPLDALIVADLGLLLTLKEMKWPTEIHISTGGTTFNSETARFYHEEFGAERIVLPRHHTADEIVHLAKTIDFMEVEAFIFNAGCKNIDGFCTYQHGTNEILHKGSWQLPKKFGIDQAFFKSLRALTPQMAVKFTRALGGSPDSACLLNYDIAIAKGSGNKEEEEAAIKWLESTFNVYSGLDPCGACDLYRFHRAGVVSVKIVGRENPLWKKERDVRFLRGCLDHLVEKRPSQGDYEKFCREHYRKVIGSNCLDWCYYPRTGSQREKVTT